jgi:hypothetical protein
MTEELFLRFREVVFTAHVSTSKRPIIPKYPLAEDNLCGVAILFNSHTQRQFAMTSARPSLALCDNIRDEPRNLNIGTQEIQRNVCFRSLLVNDCA